jgi:hypothetical protein
MVIKGQHNHAWVVVLQVQRVVSIGFICVACLFPPYILARYGLSVGPLYDRWGNVTGHINYFVASLGLAALFVLVAGVSFRVASKVLLHFRESK